MNSNTLDPKNEKVPTNQNLPENESKFFDQIRKDQQISNIKEVSEIKSRLADIEKQAITIEEKLRDYSSLSLLKEASAALFQLYKMVNEIYQNSQRSTQESTNTANLIKKIEESNLTNELKNEFNELKRIRNSNIEKQMNSAKNEVLNSNNELVKSMAKLDVIINEFGIKTSQENLSYYTDLLNKIEALKNYILNCLYISEKKLVDLIHSKVSFDEPLLNESETKLNDLKIVEKNIKTYLEMNASSKINSHFMIKQNEEIPFNQKLNEFKESRKIKKLFNSINFEMNRIESKDDQIHLLSKDEKEFQEKVKIFEKKVAKIIKKKFELETKMRASKLESKDNSIIESLQAKLKLKLNGVLHFSNDLEIKYNSLKNSRRNEEEIDRFRNFQEIEEQFNKFHSLLLQIAPFSDQLNFERNEEIVEPKSHEKSPKLEKLAHNLGDEVNELEY